MNDRLISLSAAIDAVHKNYDTILDFTSDGKTISYSIEDILSELPSGTDICVGGNLKYDEWCTDCKEYDQERHSCPRWNRVIRQTVEDVKAAQPGWISVTERLPDESGEYLVTIRYKDGGNDVTGLIKYISRWREWNDVELFGGEVIAWQPKPKPWKGDVNG